MRIAVNASIVDPFLSGLGVYAVNLLKELAKLHDDLVAYISYPEVCGIDLTKVRSISRGGSVPIVKIRVNSFMII